MPVEFEMERANGEFKTTLTAYTTESVTRKNVQIGGSALRMLNSLMLVKNR